MNCSLTCKQTKTQTRQYPTIAPQMTPGTVCRSFALVISFLALRPLSLEAPLYILFLSSNRNSRAPAFNPQTNISYHCSDWMHRS
jgi:hypothetical protein